MSENTNDNNLKKQQELFKKAVNGDAKAQLEFLKNRRINVLSQTKMVSNLDGEIIAPLIDDKEKN